MTSLTPTADPLLPPTATVPPAVAVATSGRQASIVVWLDRLALPGVAALAAILYVLNLTVSGYGNLYYAAAAQAASQSWSAWFFGALDGAGFITIDKPPLGTMLIGLSVRLFGLSEWSVLLPQALAGVAAVVVLFLAVRRPFGTAAATIAAIVMAVTPAAVLIFRYDNPDALMTLLLIVAAYAFVRAHDTTRRRWLVLAGLAIGLAFETKFLQAWLVLPAFAVAWAIAGPGSWRRRTIDLVASAATVVLASAWWVAVVELVPAASRPYIGGSATNSALELLLGYDGLGRIFGQGGGGGAGPGGPGGGGFSGTPGLLRLFNEQLGGQAAWFLPLAAISVVAVLWLGRRAARADAQRASVLLWGGWLAVHALVFSLMSGIIHSYYTVVLAPAIGAMVGIGVVSLWRARAATRWAGPVLGLGFAVTGAVAWWLLGRTPDFAPGLDVLVLSLSIAAGIVVALPAAAIDRRLALGAAVLGLAALLVGPAAYAADTMQTAYRGGDAAAGPQVAGDAGFGGRAPGGAGGGGPLFNGAGPGGGTVDSALADYLIANRGGATWIVAVNGAEEAAQIQLATGAPVMAMGGFSGGDPAPTVDQLRAYVASGRLRYVLVGGRGGPGRGGGAVADWVTANGTLVDAVGNGSLYDLSGAVDGS